MGKTKKKSRDSTGEILQGELSPPARSKYHGSSRVRSILVAASFGERRMKSVGDYSLAVVSMPSSSVVEHATLICAVTG